MASGRMTRTLASQGQKIWFPNIQFTLLKYDGPSQVACFRVPLNLNKLDIKNYLRNVYQIEAVQIATRIYQYQRAPEASTGDHLADTGQSSAKAHKKAYVTLKEAFQWPEPDPKWKEYLDRPKEREAQMQSAVARDAFMRNMRTHTMNPELLKRVKGPKPFART